MTQPQIRPTFTLVTGATLPGQPIDAADYESWKLQFEACLREGRLYDRLADTTLDLVPGSVLHVSWSVVDE